MERPSRPTSGRVRTAPQHRRPTEAPRTEDPTPPNVMETTARQTGNQPYNISPRWPGYAFLDEATKSDDAAPKRHAPLKPGLATHACSAFLRIRSLCITLGASTSVVDRHRLARAAIPPPWPRTERVCDRRRSPRYGMIAWPVACRQVCARQLNHVSSGEGTIASHRCKRSCSDADAII